MPDPVLPAVRRCVTGGILLLLSASAAAQPGAPSITNPPAAQTIFLGDPATFYVGATGNAPLSYQWLRNGATLVNATASSLTIATTAADDQAQISVRVENSLGAVTSPPVALTIDFGIPGPPQTNQFVPILHPWRYDVSKTDLGAAWRAFGYNDSAWPVGGALLYYTSASLPAPKTTQLPVNPSSLPVTCYFRARFTNNLADAYSISLAARTVVDDGVVVYLNGVEVLRRGMPSGNITYNTFANRTVLNAAYEGPFNVATASLLPGANVLAAEVHQVNASSRDVVMGMTLQVVWRPRLRDTEPPTVATTVPPAGATLAELDQVEVIFSEAVQGVDAADLRINGAPATNLVINGADAYVFQFPPATTGLVSVTWAPGHGITDQSANSNALVGTDFTYHLDPLAFATQVRITEFMAANSNGIRDEDGDRSDWIELLNSGVEAVNLEGWSLTDNANQLTKWRFPAVTLLPGSYLLVWASGKDRATPAAPLHTNFRLGRAGQYLGLIYKDGVTVASHFSPAYPPQYDDVSYGRDRVDPSLTGFFTNATPGAPNSTTGHGFGPEVEFSLASRPFVSAFQLTLSQPDTNFVIRYFLVTNAVSAALTNVPNSSSPLYSGPIFIGGTTQVRARAFPVTPGWFPGPPGSETYVLMSPPAYAFTSDLPLVLVHNFAAGTIPSSVDQSAVVMFFGTNWGRASFANPPDLAVRAGINRRGSSTQNLPKVSLAVEAWDEYNEDRMVSVLGMPAESDWVLYAPNAFDTALVHNPFAFEASRALGRYASRARFAEVFLCTGGGPVLYAPPAGGHYNGLYVIEEKVKRDNNRVDIAPLRPQHTNAPAVTGGYLLKIDRADSDERSFNTANGQTIVYQDPKGPEIQLPERAPQATYIRNFFNAFEAALYGANYTNPVTGYAPYIDRASWIDHHIINALCYNVDALRLSAYFYKDREKPIEMGPVWDFDRSLGSSGYGDVRSFNPRLWRVQASGDQGTDYFGNPNLLGVRWWQRLFTDPDFWQAWIDRWQEARRGPYSNPNLHALVDQLTDPIREAQGRELFRWTETRPRSGSVSANGYTHTFPGTYQGEVDFLKQWLTHRATFIDTNFLRPPVFSHPGGAVSNPLGLNILAAAPLPNTVIFYTLDGTDPRLPGGGVSPAAVARTNNAVVILTNNARVFARNFNPLHANVTNFPGSVGGNPPISSSWSGPTVATFYNALPPLRLAEIMYHPPPPPPGDPTDKNEFEYLEFQNISGAPLQLAGFTISRGVEFTFPALELPAGGRVLVVKNLAAFHARYGTGFLIAGEFAKQLDNAGERLVLTGPLGEPIHDFRYRDDWYPITDGGGFSLVVRDVVAGLDQWGLKEGWRPSGAERGTPGAPDDAPPVFPPILITEALSHTDVPQVDFIELHNPTTTNVNLAGWFLTDNLQRPRKYRLPASFVIPPGGYAIVSENQFGVGAEGFGLSATGEEVYLFSGDAQTNLTGYLHGFAFDASPNGVSFGRHVDSLGREHFPLQIVPTPGAANTRPRIGPVVISEIMYYPPDVSQDLNEFIELTNLAPTNTPLSDPAFPTNTFRLRGGVDFDFPPGVVMAPGERLLVVGFPPGATARLNEFRARYAVPPDTRFFGPWSGRLNNAGETVRLRLPDSPNVSGGVVAVPYYIAEEITYSPTAPWPAAAAGEGFSLQRVDLAAFADDPANWQATGATPGRPNAPNAPPQVTLLAPVDGAAPYNGPFIAVAAEAQDPDGTVQQVEFFEGGIALMTVTEPPYLFTWVNALPGPRVLRAVATDNLGVSSTSAPVAITVLSGTDTDGDGMPDDWELASGTDPNVPDGHLDYDADGMTNYEEFIAGTSPTNAASVLRITAQVTAGGQRLLSFEAISNRTYTVLTTPALGEDWSPWVNIPAASTNRTIPLTNLPAAPRYWRVSIP